MKTTLDKFPLYFEKLESEEALDERMRSYRAKQVWKHRKQKESALMFIITLPPLTRILVNRAARLIRKGAKV